MVTKKTGWMVKVMNIAICDDERNFAKMLKDYISEYAAIHDFTNHVELYFSPTQLLRADLSKCDVVFLDIEMPGIDGIETARQLRQQYDELLLVFITGWIKYAPDGYRVNAFRYLLKKSLPEDLWLCLDEIQEKLFENTECISLRNKERELEIPLKNIVYFEGTRQKNVLVYLKHELTPIECYGKISEMDELLQEKGFLRIQKSFLVNMAYIEKIRNYKARLRNGTELKVSERQYQSVNQQYLIWRGHML